MNKDKKEGDQMNGFTFYSPTMFVFGREEENNVGDYVKRFGGSKVLIHYGGGSAVQSGLIHRVKCSLEKEKISYVSLGGAQPNPRSGLVYEGIELCRKEKVDFVLAVGGGSSIDSAKAIALGTLYNGDFWDFYERDLKIEKALPVGTVLTIAAAGSEGSGNTVITHEKGGYKRGAGGDILRPKFSILNPELTFTLPAYQTACGVVDIMAHILERYFTNTKEVEITDRMCEAVLLTMLKEAPKAVKGMKSKEAEYEVRANIMWAGTIAHNNICGVGREQDWASHHLEHELSALYDCAHGAGLAVIFPAWMEYVMKHDILRFTQFAVRVMGCEMDYMNPEHTAMEGIQALKEFWKSLGMPVNFKELGAKEEDIPVLLNTLQIDGRTEGHFVPLVRKDCEAIYRLAAREK